MCSRATALNDQHLVPYAQHSINLSGTTPAIEGPFVCVGVKTSPEILFYIKKDYFVLKDLLLKLKRCVWHIYCRLFVIGMY